MRTTDTDTRLALLMAALGWFVAALSTNSLLLSVMCLLIAAVQVGLLWRFSR